MKLQAARDNGGQEDVRGRSGEDQGRGAGGFLQDFQKDVGDVPAHGLRAIENEDAAAAHGLEVGGALHCAKLADAEHRAGYGRFQAYRIRDERPDVGVRLQDERHTFDCGGVCAFAALGQALLDKFLWFGQQADALAGSAFAAEVVGETLAVGGLRKHARQRVLADSTRASEEQCVRDAVGCAARHGARLPGARCRGIRRSPC